MPTINKGWIDVVKSTKEADLANISSYSNLNSFLAKNNIKDNKREGVYANGPLIQSIGVVNTDTDKTSTKSTALVNVRMDATATGYHILTVRTFSARSEKPNGDLVKTGILKLPDYAIVAGVAAACGRSIGYRIATSAVDYLEEIDFDWGFSSTKDTSGKAIPLLLGEVKTSSGTDNVYVYIEENVLERLIKALDDWGLFDLDPSGYVPYEPVMNIRTEYDFHGRFPNIPDEYVDKFERLINDEVNTHTTIGPFWPEHIDPNANMYLFCSVLENHQIDIIIAENNYLRITFRSDKLNTEAAFEPSLEGEVQDVISFNFSGDFTYFYKYTMDPDGTMYKADWDFEGYGNASLEFTGDQSGVCYDVFGEYRSIEWADDEHTKIKLGPISMDYSQVHIDENATDLRQLQEGETMEELMPDWWAKRIKASTPIMVSGVRDYPVASDLNHKRWFLPINIPDAAIDPNSTQADSLDGLASVDLLNQAIDDTPSIAPYIGIEADPPVTDTPKETPPIPTLPDGIGAFIGIYSLSETQLKNFANWLWSSNVIDNLIRIVENPLDAVIGLHAIYTAPAVKQSGVHPILGNLVANTVTADIIKQYNILSCGGKKVEPHFNNINDYVATKIQLFLPFIGFVDLSPMEVMNRWIFITYHIDYVTGTCVAFVKIQDTQVGAPFTAYTFSGNCAIEMPVTGSTYAEILRNAIMTGAGLIGSSMGVGAEIANAGANAGNLVAGDVLQGETHAIMMKAQRGRERERAVNSAITTGAASLGGQAVNGAASVATSQHPVQRSGNLGANAGAMSIKVPYLLITRNVAVDAKQREKFEGLPTNENVRLSTLSGYTRVKYINLEGLSCTEQEKADIIAKLQGGVII